MIVFVNSVSPLIPFEFEIAAFRNLCVTNYVHCATMGSAYVPLVASAPVCQTVCPLKNLNTAMLKPGLQTFPWLSMICLCIAYGLLGWRLSSLSSVWLVDAWLITVLFIFLVIWRGQVLIRLFRMGPRSLVLIFLLSMTLNFAFVYAEVFGFVLILLLTILLGRLELQTNGWRRHATLSILSLLAGGALTGGWFLSRSTVVLETLQRISQWLHIVFGQG